MRLKLNQVKAQLSRLEGWKLVRKQISKLYVFEDFTRAIRFINQVARLADSMNHHPDIDIRYNKVRLTLTTHDEGGLTFRDFKLAKRIDVIKRR